MAQKLGNFLVREGLITSEQLENALQEQKANGGMLGSNLVKMGYIEEAELMEFLSKQFGVPSTDPSKLDVDLDVIEMIPGNIVQKYRIIPISLEGQTLTIAMVDPSNIFIIDDIKFLTRKNIRVTVATESSIKSAVRSTSICCYMVNIACIPRGSSCRIRDCASANLSCILSTRSLRSSRSRAMEICKTA